MSKAPKNATTAKQSAAARQQAASEALISAKEKLDGLDRQMVEAGEALSQADTDESKKVAQEALARIEAEHAAAATELSALTEPAEPKVAKPKSGTSTATPADAAPAKPADTSKRKFVATTEIHLDKKVVPEGGTVMIDRDTFGPLKAVGAVQGDWED